MLIIFGGLPGAGKSTLARQLARKLGAVYLRIDTIERAVADGDEAVPIDDKGYRVAYAVAEDNLRLGRTVIGDSVNPLHITRDAWRSVAQRAAVRAVEIEVICSDRGEHRRRIETRLADIPVTWDEVMMRNYEPWRSGNHISIDTAGQDIAQSFATLLRLLPEQSRN
jgi:predicted kinase